MNQGVEKGMVLLLLLVTKFLLPVLVLVPDRGMLLPGAASNKHSTELEAQTCSWSLWVSMPLSDQAKKGITVLGGLIDPDYQRKSVLLLIRSFRMECRGSYLCILYPVIKVNGKLQFNPGKVTEVTDPQE